MDWYPLYNSVRIAAVATLLAFFLGIATAQVLRRMPIWLKGVLDVCLTLPLVLPPTVVGFFLIQLLGPNQGLGRFLWEYLGVQVIMTWPAAILSTLIVIFPLMYRTARGAFEHFDPQLREAGLTLGLSPTRIFWQIQLPTCKQGILAGCVLAFARGIGEYGATSMVAGYTPGRTATISTTVYQLWRIGEERQAYQWVGLNILFSCVVLLVINEQEKRQQRR